MHTFTVLGLGKEGLSVTFRLLQRANTKKVVVYEPYAERISEAKQRLRHMLRWSIGQLERRFEVADTSADRALLPGNVWLCCAPHDAEHYWIDRARRVRRPILLLSGSQYALNAQQERIGATGSIVLSCSGVAPNFVAVVGAYAAMQYKSTIIQMCCGGNSVERPDAAAYPLLWKAVYPIESMAEGLAGYTACLEAGELKLYPACSCLHMFDRLHERINTGHVPRQTIEYFRDHFGVKEAWYNTLRYYGHRDAIERTLGNKLGTTEWPITPSVLAERLKAVPGVTFNPSVDRDCLIISVKGLRWENGECVKNFPHYYRRFAFDEKTGETAMARVTSACMAFLSCEVAAGRIKAEGFCFPEQVLTLEQMRRMIRTLDTWLLPES